MPTARPARPIRRPTRDPAARLGEARALFRALRDHARAAMELAQQAGAGPPHFRTHPYRDFRAKLSEFQALSSLLRARMEEAAGNWADGDRAAGRADAATAEFDRLDALMLSLFVRTSRRYFTFLSFDRTVPLGAVEWLRRDLAPLRAALEALREPRLGRMLDPGLEAELTIAIMILTDLIARLPELPDFEAAAPG